MNARWRNERVSKTTLVVYNRHKREIGDEKVNVNDYGSLGGVGGCGRWAAWGDAGGGRCVEGCPWVSCCCLGWRMRRSRTSKYRGFIEKMWSKREEILKMNEGQPT